MVEPVQGEGGVNIPADMSAYFQGLRQVCDDNGWLLMLDEVQSGIARTGTWFAFQHTGIVPDVMSLAKGLGSGVPIGACVAKGLAADVFVYGKHGSTFGGNPLATAAGLTTINVIEDEKLRENAQKMGDLICDGFKAELANTKGVTLIRHAGLMIGIELDRPCADLVKTALSAKLLINVTADNVIRLLPPLVINAEESQALVSRLSLLIKAFLQNK